MRSFEAEHASVYFSELFPELVFRLLFGLVGMSHGVSIRVFRCARATGRGGAGSG
jgi:hypothetical protein